MLAKAVSPPSGGVFVTCSNEIAIGLGSQDTSGCQPSPGVNRDSLVVFQASTSGSNAPSLWKRVAPSSCRCSVWPNFRASRF